MSQTVVVAIILVACTMARLANIRLEHFGLNHELIAAVKRYDAAAVASCINQGADPNARDIERPEPFIWTVYRMAVRLPAGDSEAPSALAVVFDNSVILDNAVPGSGGKVFEGHLRPEPAGVVRALLAGGASASVSNGQGSPSIIVAVQDGYTECARLMLEHGADPNAHSLTLGSVLTNSIGTHDDRLIATLIRKGADVNAKDSNGDTPIKIAKENGTPEIVAILLRAGAR